ncbi:MAG TPA: flavin reductase family protein [Candidatus Nanoarchaeia archaeon]|nr:flavin reductase family protein [Candidatus Nanoarchaeia archaeon]
MPQSTQKEKNSEKLSHSSASLPRQIALITTEGETELLGKTIERQSITTVSWHTPVSYEPQLYGVALGKESFSLELIKKSQVFAVNFMAPGFSKQALFCGRHSGKGIDKFSETKLTAVECGKIHCVRIKEASAWIECEVQELVEVGDHIFVIGRVLNCEGDVLGKRLFQAYSDEEKRFTTTV